MLAWYKRRGADVHALVAFLSFIFALVAASPGAEVLLLSFMTNVLALIANVLVWHKADNA